MPTVAENAPAAERPPCRGADRDPTAPERNLAIAEWCGREAERPLREGKHGWGVLRHTLTGTAHKHARHRTRARTHIKCYPYAIHPLQLEQRTAVDAGRARKRTAFQQHFPRFDLRAGERLTEDVRRDRAGETGRV